MPEVSIIIPVYNVAPYLPRCLDSILNQTWRDFEVILVCDGPDKDMAICEEYTATYENFILIRNVGKGLGGARNAGIKIARGEWISFIDADDWIEDDFLEKMINVAKSDKEIDIVHCGTHIIYEYLVDEQLKRDDSNYFTITTTEIKKIDNDIYGRVNVAVWNKLYRKNIIDKFQLIFPEHLLAEDAYFTWCFWACSRKAGYIKDKLNNYVRRKDSLMGQSFDKKLGDRVLEHLIIEELFYSFLIYHNLFSTFSDAFWRSYEIMWNALNNYANKESKKKSFFYAKKFLSNKSISKTSKLLYKIKYLDYDQFIDPYSCINVINLFNYNILIKIRCSDYKEIIIFNKLKYKYKFRRTRDFMPLF